MPLLNRSTLKNYFKQGTSPTEVNFADLIESTVNKVDDGFSKTDKDGLMLSPKGNTKSLLSFYDDIRDKEPEWTMAINKDKENRGLAFQGSDGESSLFLKDGGNVGIMTDAPKHPLEVNGMVSMQGRIGNYNSGEVPGDGQWHPILTELDEIQAFEVVASIRGSKGRGKYAFTHAIAVATFGASRWRIRHTRAYWGWFWNRISLRWRGDVHNYQLQIRTMTHYGMNELDEPRPIKYAITRLW